MKSLIKVSKSKTPKYDMKITRIGNRGVIKKTFKDTGIKTKTVVKKGKIVKEKVTMPKKSSQPGDMYNKFKKKNAKKS